MVCYPCSAKYHSECDGGKCDCFDCIEYDRLQEALDLSQQEEVN